MKSLVRLLLVTSLLTLSACGKQEASAPPSRLPRVPAMQPESGPVPARETAQSLPAMPDEDDSDTEDGVKTVPAPSDAADEPVELVKHTVQFDDDKPSYVVFAPADAKIDADNARIEVESKKHFHLIIELGRPDFEQAVREGGRDSSVVSRTPDTVMKKGTAIRDFTNPVRIETHHFVTGVTVGYRDFRISSSRIDSGGLAVYTRAQCERMLEAARQFALADPLPEDPAEILELYGNTINRDDEGQVTYLALFEATDSTLPLLEKLPTLTDIRFNGYLRITVHEPSYAVLAHLPRLTRLDLLHTGFGDQAVDYLSGLKELKTLSIGPLTSVGLEKLHALQSLETLDLNVELDDSEPGKFPILPHLKELQLTGKFHGTSLGRLAELPDLVSLDLSNSGVDDDGVAQLTRLPKLQKLSLEFTKISDKSLEVLAGMKSLKELNASSPTLTGAACAKLKAALPNCDVNCRNEK